MCWYGGTEKLCDYTTLLGALSISLVGHDTHTVAPVSVNTSPGALSSMCWMITLWIPAVTPAHVLCVEHYFIGFIRCTWNMKLELSENGVYVRVRS